MNGLQISEKSGVSKETDLAKNTEDFNLDRIPDVIMEVNQSLKKLKIKFSSFFV